MPNLLDVYLLLADHLSDVREAMYGTDHPVAHDALVKMADETEDRMRRLAVEIAEMTATRLSSSIVRVGEHVACAQCGEHLGVWHSGKTADPVLKTSCAMHTCDAVGELWAQTVATPCRDADCTHFDARYQDCTGNSGVCPVWKARFDTL